MERLCLGIVIAAGLALLLPAIPSFAWLLGLTFSLWFLPKGGRIFLAGGLLYFASLQQDLQQYQQTSATLLAQNITEFCLTVESIPRQFEQSVQFIATDVHSCRRQAAAQGDPPLSAGKLLVSWQQQVPMPISAGQRWRMRGKLKPLHSLSNFSLPYRQRSFIVEHIHARAVVSEATLIDDTASFRSQLFSRLSQCCRQYDAYPLWLALTIGERPFSATMWQGVQAGGLAHLLSISGMHIALFFSSALFVGAGLRRIVGRSRVFDVTTSLVALMAAWAYAQLAGLAIPTLRAALGVTVVVLTQLLTRRFSIWRLSLLLQAVMLLIWPMLIFSYSFWLSSAALWVLAYLQWRYPVTTGMRAVCLRFVQFQAGFSVLLLPLTLLMFGGVAPLAFLVNLLVLPYVTVVLMPVLFLVFAWLCVDLPLPHVVFDGLDWLFSPLVQVLHRLALPELWWPWPDISLSLVVLAAVLALFCYLPLGQRRWLVLPLLWPLIQSADTTSPPSLFVLDVGQGSCAVLQFGSKALVFDLGIGKGAFSSTEQILLPFLRSRGIQQLAAVVVSHDDNDHRGNWPLLQHHFPSTELISDIRTLAPRYNCGVKREWPGIRLTTWRATSYTPTPGNEQSCVSLLQLGERQIIFPADLGKNEMALAAVIPNAKQRLLILGHHGSYTASSLAFLTQIEPALAIASAGFGNAFGHPAAATQARLQLLQIPLYSTATAGAVRIDFHNERMLIRTARGENFAPWLEKSAGVAETAPVNR